MPSIAFFECSRCHHHLPPAPHPTLCPLCASPLYVRYDMAALKQSTRREDIAAKAAASPASLGMWRYAAILPSGTPDHPITPVTLGEGWTPLLQSRRYPHLYLKEEGANPTGAFNARGLSLAVTMARHYGLQHLAVASAGNAAGALAAYAAAAGLHAHIFMPQDVPLANYLEGIVYDAELHLVDGPISDCARLLSETIAAQKASNTPPSETWFDISSLKDPFLLEGAKTIAYELAEQLNWTYPDAVLYPTRGGAGLISIAKAFDELEQLGWIKEGSRRPKMYALHVPRPDVDPLVPNILEDILAQSGGKALSVTDDQILSSILDWAKNEGIFLSPEGATATAAYNQLLASGELKPTDKVVLINIAAGLKYTAPIADAMRLPRPTQRKNFPTSMPVGGIITPQ